jgi:hypothetical protein
MKYKKEQFEKDYKQAFNLILELDQLLHTITIDIQYDHAPKAIEEDLLGVQMRLLRKLSEKRLSSFQTTIGDLVHELEEIKEKKCEV